MLCDAPGVTASGYYASRGRSESGRAVAERALLGDIRRIHQQHHHRYRAPRIYAVLRAEGRPVGRGRLERRMQRHGIRATASRRFRVVTTDSNHGLPIADNLLDQNLLATRPSEIWLADITSIPTDAGWLYLATVLDLFTRQVVGWAMRDHLRQERTIAALTMAIQRQWPTRGLIHHADRGSQYAAGDDRAPLKANEIVPSMSRKGICWDNAPMESWFHTLKPELVHHTRYTSRHEARRDLFAYIETYDNRQRLRSALGYRVPEQAELQAA